MHEWILIVIISLGFLGFFALIIVGGISDDKYRKKQAEESAAVKKKPKEDYPEPETITFHAKVVKMECATRHVGIKQPKLIKEFLVFFEDDEGKAIRLFVDEEYYLSMEVGQVGNLTLIDGELYSFVLDE